MKLNKIKKPVNKIIKFLIKKENHIKKLAIKCSISRPDHYSKTTLEIINKYWLLNNNRYRLLKEAILDEPSDKLIDILNENIILVLDTINEYTKILLNEYKKVKNEVPISK